MKNITFIIFAVSSILLLNKTVCSQEDNWPKIYGDNQYYIVRNLIETYDYGYLISGFSYTNSGQQVNYGILIKTDINGQVLWEKKIGAVPKPGKTGGGYVKQLTDGSYIITGTTYIYDVYGDAYFLKLNVCGEKEWSKIFYNTGSTEYGTGIVSTNDGNYLIMVAYWGDDLANERIWLFKIGQDGEIVWQKVYAKWSLGTNDEDGYNLIKNADNEYLITGGYYQYNPGEDTNARYVRPMFIKVDSTGNEMWHLLWGVDEYFYGVAFKSAFNSSGYIYSVGQNSSVDFPGDRPELFKISKTGSQLYSKDLIENADGGGATTISILEDSVLFIGATWRDYNDVIHNGVMKTDTLGNILVQRDLLNVSSSFYSSIITHDNKYLVAGNFFIGNNWDIYLWKFNKDLEYDSIYTQPRVYDSLCPHEIVSDTIDLDTTTVNLQELYQQMHRIQVRPNPAGKKLTVTLGVLTNGTELKLYNTNGQAVKQVPVQRYKREYEINITGLPPGLYVVVLFDKGKVADKRKVIISGK
ncbi:MAG: T9SS type A sorting domain-containing protein [Chlorobi bacterium]|nr:T9SS type A sorting domain-containing protein [Chlorobiota bacterium]